MLKWQEGPNDLARASAVAKYYITYEYRSSCVRMMKQMEEMQHEGLNHPGQRSLRTKRDEGDIKSLR